MCSAVVKKMVSGLSVDELVALWKAAKEKEVGAIEYRREIEEAIAAQVDLKPEGVTRIGALAVDCGYARKWDNDGLTLLKEGFPFELWPFKTEWKEDRKGTRWIETNAPELWRQIEPALTIKDRKPSFSWKGEKA